MNLVRLVSPMLVLGGVKLYTDIYGEDSILNHKPMPYIVYLGDIYGNPLTGLTATFNINGVNYNRVTGSDGGARLNINLPLSNYPIMYSFQENNSLYKFGYEYVAVDVTPLNNNQLYFISFEDSSAIQEIGSIDLITSSGILLYSNNGYVSIRYYRYFTNLTSFNVIFDGKQYNGKYISNVTL